MIFECTVDSLLDEIKRARKLLGNGKFPDLERFSVSREKSLNPGSFPGFKGSFSEFRVPRQSLHLKVKYCTVLANIKDFHLTVPVGITVRTNTTLLTTFYKADAVYFYVNI